VLSYVLVLAADSVWSSYPSPLCLSTTVPHLAPCIDVHEQFQSVWVGDHRVLQMEFCYEQSSDLCCTRIQLNWAK
jgi:hypothetical protein